MEQSYSLATIASALFSTGLVFCVSKNTRAFGVGVMAGGLTFALCALIAFLTKI